MVRIKSFGVLQTAKIAAVLYFLGSAIICIPMALLAMLGGALGSEQGFIGGVIGGIMLLFAPFLYAGIGFVFVALGSAIYNIVAGYVGGIEIELEQPGA